MKVTVTHTDGSVSTLIALRQLVESAEALVTASMTATGTTGAPATATVKVNVTPTRKVRSIEVSW